jgi:hypothetical protein
VTTNLPVNQQPPLLQGANAQNWAGPVMAEDDTSLGNSDGYEAPGTASPYEQTYATNSPAGFATQAGEDDSTYATDGNSGDNATPLGGGNGPSANFGSSNSALMGQTAQSWSAVGQQTDKITVTVPNYTGAKATALASAVTPSFSGGTSPYTVSALTEMPTGFTFSTSTGAISLADTTVAGTYDLAFMVTDSATPDGHEAEYGVTVTLS